MRTPHPDTARETGPAPQCIDRPDPRHNQKEKRDGIQTKLSTLWIFATLNYLYCDVTGLMDPAMLKQYLAGNLGGLQMTQGFLLATAIFVEIKVSMVLLSRLLGHRANRWANIAAGAFMTLS